VKENDVGKIYTLIITQDLGEREYFNKKTIFFIVGSEYIPMIGSI
jgi:hypothetical protein